MRYVLVLLLVVAAMWAARLAATSIITGMPVASSRAARARQPSPIAPTSASRPAPDFDAHIARLRDRFPPNHSFSIVIERPFVVIGDESPRVVQRRAVDTVRFAVDRLRRDFFARDPRDIIDIWLFKDDASYRKNTKLLFGDDPRTPFGYYAPRHRALIMNIATGGGTLVHEIVHPFMHTNFPSCPAWYNEGLGSLFEQSADRDGHIHGLTNWRLAGLQAAIRANSLPPFDELLSMNDETFYGDNSGVHYAQARYLCYYLQEHGLLLRFHAEFLNAADKDPTGIDTLRRVLNEPDLAVFAKRWSAEMLNLAFP